MCRARVAQGPPRAGIALVRSSPDSSIELLDSRPEGLDYLANPLDLLKLRLQLGDLREYAVDARNLRIGVSNHVARPIVLHLRRNLCLGVQRRPALLNGDHQSIEVVAEGGEARRVQ